MSAFCLSLARHVSLFLSNPIPMLPFVLIFLGWTLCQAEFAVSPVLYFFPGDPPPPPPIHPRKYSFCKNVDAVICEFVGDVAVVWMAPVNLELAVSPGAAP